MMEAIIFDLDGTLWDSTGCAAAIWNRVFKRHTEVDFSMTPEKASQLMGKTMEEIGVILFPDYSEEHRKYIVDDFGSEEVEYLHEHGAVLFADVEETLELLNREYGLYIVSNCQDGYVDAFLHAHKLEKCFKDIEMSGRTGLNKGCNIRLIVDRNHIKDTVYVGDTAGDEQAAREAGIPFIWAKYGFGKAVSPDASIAAFKDLPKVLSDLT